LVRRQVRIADWLWRFPQAEGNPSQRHLSHPKPMRRLQKTQNTQATNAKNVEPTYPTQNMGTHKPHYF
jgi:hypothetical protein